MVKNKTNRQARATRSWARLALGLVVLASPFFGSCDSSSDGGRARAFVVDSRTQLIGGPTALGDIGDYMLENDRVRVVIQDKTFNRGAGVFGGSLIDADLVRPTNSGTVLGGSGNDSFGELFPAFFLEMINPEEIEVINDGKDGNAAIVEVRGRGGEFVTMLRYLNQLLLNSYKEPSNVVQDIVKGVPPDSDTAPNLAFSTRYILEPGARHLRIESTMRNISHRTLEFPPKEILGALAGFAGLDLGNFRLPMGHVLGFGKLSKVFLPGLGYDIELGLLDALSVPVPLPAFPGFLTPIVASTNSHGVNYGFATSDDPDTNFVYQRDKDGAYMGRAGSDDMLYLFNASGFGGVFSSEAPVALSAAHCQEGADPQSTCESLFPDKVTVCVSQWDRCIADRAEHPNEFTYTNYFLIGDGDVASLMEELYRIRGTEVHAIRGRVSDAVTGSPVPAKDSVLVYTNEGGADCKDVTIVNQVYVTADGRFELDLPDGKYCARSKGPGRPLGDMVAFEVAGKPPASLQIIASSPATVFARIVGEDGVAMPGKLTIVGTHDYEGPEPNYREFLMDEVSGEPWRATDLVPDQENAPETRRYIEQMAYGGPDGITLKIRPGKYIAHLSRGPEYDVFTKEIEVQPGGTTRIQATLRRVLDTTGYVSGDFHMHGLGSIDSGLDHRTRLTSIAAEGVESVVSTDHNYITDYEPWIYRFALHPYLKSIIGLELTTFEAGHFNGFPVQRTLTSMNRGSFAWQEIPPKAIFSEMRAMAPEGQSNIIQVNHPRTPILGYFEQHNMNPFDSTVELPLNVSSGGFSADTLASPNGRAFIETEEVEGQTVYKSTFSWDFDVIEVFNGPHLEELRHFRMPYDKDAPAGDPEALPEEARQGFRDTLTADLSETEINTALAEFLSTETTEVTAEDVAAMSMAEREQAIDDWVHSQIPPQWSVLCDEDSVIAAGGLDDWYNLLNYPRPDGSYRKYTATGNSDSHGAHLDEPGLPRNYFWVGHDDPERITGAQLVEAMKSHHNIISNGPFINMTIDDKPVGSEVTASGSVRVNITVQAADWVGADRMRLVGNGEVVRGLEPNQSDDYWGWIPIELDSEGKFAASYDVPVTKDTWFVLEVESSKNMFPIHSPQDIPPFNFSDVIGSLAGAFGFGAGVPGLDQTFVFPMTAFAFTNPIWVVADGDGEFTPPSPPVYECVAGQYVERGAANALLSPDAFELDARRLNAVKIPNLRHRHNPLARPKGENRDLRIIFEAWGGHKH